MKTGEFVLGVLRLVAIALAGLNHPRPAGRSLGPLARAPVARLASQPQPVLLPQLLHV